MSGSKKKNYPNEDRVRIVNKFLAFHADYILFSCEAFELIREKYGMSYDCFRVLVAVDYIASLRPGRSLVSPKDVKAIVNRMREDSVYKWLKKLREENYLNWVVKDKNFDNPSLYCLTSMGVQVIRYYTEQMNLIVDDHKYRRQAKRAAGILH